MSHQTGDAPLSDEKVIADTQAWLEKAVIGLNLCPFAKSVYVKDQVSFVVSHARDVDTLIEELATELERLAETSPKKLDTTLLIHPYVLNDFLDFNDFLDIADSLVAELELEGELQIASFHPDYQFADTKPDDIENFTNRSPYPTLHLLRETSIEKAVEAFPDAGDIYEKNIETMTRLGHEGWRKLGLPFGRKKD
jgi:hypothetical protein